MSGFRDLVVCILCVAGMCCAAVGCLDRKGARMDEPVYYKDTAAYEQKLSTFTITEAQARKIVADFIRFKQGHPSSPATLQRPLPYSPKG